MVSSGMMNCGAVDAVVEGAVVVGSTVELTGGAVVVVLDRRTAVVLVTGARVLGGGAAVVVVVSGGAVVVVTVEVGSDVGGVVGSTGPACTGAVASASTTPAPTAATSDQAAIRGWVRVVLTSGLRSATRQPVV
jgi:hypothetical protein